MKIQRSHVFLLLGILLVLAVSACAPRNRIPLVYQTVGKSEWTCTAPVTVVPLEDRRGRESIGKHGQDIILFPGSSISQWASWALFDELESAGCNARYLEQAAGPLPGYKVTGTIRRLYVEKTGSPFEYASSMKMEIVATRQGDRVFTKEYSGSVVKTGTPTTENYRDLLKQTLQEILQEVVLDLTTAMRGYTGS